VHTNSNSIYISGNTVSNAWIKHRELVGQVWEEICRGLSQVLSRDMSEGTEEIREGPQSR
jgi:hypothetical protein